MSVVPLPEPRCGPYKERKYPPDVTGTANVSYGHRLRERSWCAVGKPGSRGDRKRDAGERPEDRRESERLRKIQDFEAETNRRIRRKAVALRVQEGMAAHEEDVNVRREKLRELILGEEVAYTRQVVEHAQHGADARMEEMRLKIEEVRKREEEHRLALVAAKRMQQYLSRCPEVRGKLEERTTHRVKQDNLAQMTDNKARRESERELDRLWHGLMLKEVAAKEQREIQEQKLRKLTEQETLEVLAKQVAGKLSLDEEKERLKQEERARLERLWETVREEERRNLERERANREALKRDLESQIVAAKRFLAARAREEAAMDEAMNALAREEVILERERIGESSAALRRELLAYLRYLEEIREEGLRRDAEVDRLIEQSRKDAHARRDLAVQKSKEARERRLRETIRGREEQVRARREEELREAEARRLEKELVEREVQAEAELAAERQLRARQRAACYGKELREQQERREDEARRRRAEEEERLRGEEAGREEEYRRLTEELLASSENVTPHPFKVVLRECAARRVAEKGGRCYCPPPLPE